MAEIKTKPLDSDIDKFLAAIEPEKKRTGSIELKKLFDSVVKEKAVLWNNNMIGYGTYHYKSERSSQEGDWFLVGFSPRKAAISLYVFTGAKEHEHLLSDLGKFKMGKACIYVKKLSDINQDALKKLILTTVDYLKSKYKN